MKLSFGKYKGKELSIVNKDTNYKNWLLNQSFFKNKYPDEYIALKNYFNFFECLEKYLDYDCMVMISEYFSGCEYGYLSFTFRGDLITDKIKTVFKHKENLLTVKTMLMGDPGHLTRYNVNEFKLFHQINLKRFMFSCFNQGITRGDDLYGKKYDYYIEKLYPELETIKDNKVGFGKYRDLNYDQLRYFRDTTTGFINYRIKHYVEWAEEHNVFDDKPLLKFYMDSMRDIDYSRLERNTYYN